MRCPSAGGGWGNGEGNVSYTVYFHMEFSKPLDHYGIWKIDIPDNAFPVQQGLATSYFYTDEYQDLVRRGEVLHGCKEYEGNHIGFFAEFPPPMIDEKVVVKSGISFVSVDGARKKFMKYLQTAQMSTKTRRVVKLLGMTGTIALLTDVATITPLLSAPSPDEPGP